MQPLSAVALEIPHFTLHTSYRLLWSQEDSQGHLELRRCAPRVRVRVRVWVRLWMRVWVRVWVWVRVRVGVTAVRAAAAARRTTPPASRRAWPTPWAPPWVLPPPLLPPLARSVQRGLSHGVPPAMAGLDPHDLWMRELQPPWRGRETTVAQRSPHAELTAHHVPKLHEEADLADLHTFFTPCTLTH